MQVIPVQLSIVTTVDAHVGICESFTSALAQYVTTHQLITELIFVDDLQAFNPFIYQYENPFLAIKSLTPNQRLGQFNAILLGLTKATGAKVLVMDADMTNNINDISRFITKIDSGMNVVFGRRVQRLDVIFIRRILSYLFNYFVRYMTNTHISDINTPMIMASRTALDSLKKMPRQAASHKAFLCHAYKESTCEIPITIDTIKLSSNYTFIMRLAAFYPSFIDIFKFHHYLKKKRS